MLIQEYDFQYAMIQKQISEYQIKLEDKDINFMKKSMLCAD